ncbi:Protein F37C4.5 [Tolypocladium paradoxum]|uniref:Protein F37C4.5 n=1 Tax=Tolypocladium paradoxum TaxID=94208 RepID=A0A2S4L1Q0_9HYPO|nr:Protein F37C4.5 [Tolypocladium paradoxum]
MNLRMLVDLMDSTNKVEYHVRTLGTRSVTLFPTRARVTREVKDVNLKPGTNEITIVGLSPTVDEDSVRVESNGPFVSDVSVESLPNRNIWEEVYPDSDDDEPDDDDGDSFRWKEGPELGKAKRHLAQLQDELNLASEKVASAESRLKIVDAYGQSFDSEHGHAFSAENLELYRHERAKAYQDVVAGARQKRDVSAAVDEHRQEVDRLQELDDKEARKAERARERARKPRVDELALRERRRDERRKEKARIRKEREGFWPRRCYSVRVTVEASGALTPTSSRRASVSDVDVPGQASADHDGDAPMRCDLLLSYFSTSAHWAPTYELKLSTTSAKAVLGFDAELHNTTSETWSNCKVSLSTSQATFAGLDDAIPELTPWYMSLAAMPPLHGVDCMRQISRSGEERESMTKFRDGQRQPDTQKPRSELFGIPKPVQPDLEADFGPCRSVPPPMAAPAAQKRSGGSSADTVELGSQRALGRAAKSRTLSQILQRGEKMDGLADGLGGGAVSDPVDNEPDSVVEESGLTTSFDLPGLKTLAPKNTPSKSRVAHTTFANVEYSHVVVAKHKPVAYLKAKIKNTSKMTLFKGRAGLTLDGSFMGKTTLPRCSAGEALTLSLGVDPAIKVTYPKPVFRRAAAGVFRQDMSVLHYTRSVTLHNARAPGRPVSVVVLDQVPVSRDEKLRVGVVSPPMAPGGGAVATGVGLERDKDWGRAAASLNKDGEVSWEVSLDAGKAVRLNLEYTVAFPSGTHPY